MSDSDGIRKPDILGFAMGILEESESQEVRAQIEGDAVYQTVLTKTRRLLEPLEADRSPIEAPRGLAKKALALIRENQAQSALDADIAGFAIQALDEGEMTLAKKEIENNPVAKRLFKRLAISQKALRSDRAPIQAPSGLARKTILHVRTSVSRTMPAAPPLSRDYDSSLRRSWGLRADLFAAAGLLIMFGGVIWPAIHHQRQNQRDLECQNNLAQIWRGVATFASFKNNQLPKPDLKGSRSVAGIYAPLLVENGFANPETFHVDCPVGIEKYPPHIFPSLQTLDHLYKNDRAQWREVVQGMGGNYSYSLGHLGENGQHGGFDLRAGDRHPLMADSGHYRASHNSPNHSGRGQNVLYLGGNVRFRNQRTIGQSGDDIYLNRHFSKRAGLDGDDCVLGNSGDRPNELNE